MNLFAEICSIVYEEDEISFDINSITTEYNRREGLYRESVLLVVNQVIKIDVNFEYVVKPQPLVLSYPEDAI